MTPCLLCPSPVVADGLCVPCGAKKWAAELWRDAPVDARLALEYPSADVLYCPARHDAIRTICAPEAARAFLDKLEAARKARDAAPLCSRGCASHEEEPR